MKLTAKLGCILACLVATLGTAPARAQTTDAYHSIQIFPVVVETASFTQRFIFDNVNSAALTLQPKYFVSVDISPVLMVINCPVINVPAYSTKVVTSLRTMCPTIPVGSTYGFLYVSEKHPQPIPFAGFSRVSNPAGNGFSVEAFPAHTFTATTMTVAGLRRRAATPGSPGYQTNCFIGNMYEVSPATAPPPTSIFYNVSDSAGQAVSAGASVSLQPGGFTRLLDVFYRVGAPPGDYDDARISFSDNGAGTAAVIAFCTVQDNTSFGADFRIAKQAQLNYGPNQLRDQHVSRNSFVSSETFNSLLGVTPFSVAAGTFRNIHVIYFRHPDTIACNLYDPVSPTFAALDISYGLEMRLVDPAFDIVAGGNNVVGFSGVYLGDKRQRINAANTRYTLEVESAEFNFGAKPYGIHCQSGSGHTLADIIRIGLPIGF